MKKFLKVIGIILLCIIVLLVALVEPIDRTPFTETEHYRQWKEQVASKRFKSTSGSFKVGWAKRNITPEKPGPMSGYGKRWGKHFEGVHDSLYVRVIAVENPKQTVYFLSADMLIIPPNITAKLEDLLSEDGISIKDVHLGATHTHHGLGGWGQKLAGFLFSGKYDPEVEVRLAGLFRSTILEAKQQLAESQISYRQNEDVSSIRYRLNTDGGEVDPWIRSLVFERKDGKRATLMTYAAHPTVVPSRSMQVSRDFPGALVDSLEQRGEDFAMYMAGAVGSMGSNAVGDSTSERIRSQVIPMLQHINDSLKYQLTDTMISDYFKIPMPDPGVRISLGFALRPWVFRTFFGEQDTYIKVTKIGHSLIIGVPADFSGEIMRELDAYADDKGIELIITSFDGGYIGYITPDKLYDRDLYETITMSWNGYQSGGYFTQVIKDIIDKLG